MSPALATASASYASARVTTSASRPSTTARACPPEPLRLLDIRRLTSFALPVLDERLVEVLIQLARRIVRDFEQRLRMQCHGGCPANDQRGSQPCSPSCRV